MASEQTGRGRRRQQEPETLPADETAKGKAKRKILKYERVIVIPADADDEAVKTALKEAKLPSWLKTTIANAWIVAAENEEDSQDAAIEAHAGKPGTPDAKPGIWRAVPVRGWGEATLYERPPEPKVEASKVKVD